MTPTAPSIPNILRQAVYLGMSWTWCIGMFLPVLLIRDFGHWAWWVFAIPNIAGAAAMGWVMRTREDSVAYVRNHVLACTAFSVVTIAFQIFFASWLLTELLGKLALSGVFLLFVVQVLLTRLVHVAWLAAIGFAFSLLAAFLCREFLHYPTAGPAPSLNLAWLALACLGGFLTCPYLDMTFHLARYDCKTPGESKWAFALGFGFFFVSMILLTLLYASGLLSVPALQTWIGLHIAVQLALTVTFHEQALCVLQPHTNRSSAALFIAILLGAAWGMSKDHLHLPSGETTYRLFMSFYALIFPAYVIIHLRAGQRKHWFLLLATLALAGPMFYAAFIAGYMVWLLPGTATLLVAYIAADVIRQRSPSPPPPRS